MKRSYIWLLILSLVFGCVTRFSSQAEDSVQDLQQSASGLEDELAGLNSEAEALKKELSYIISQMKQTAETLEQTRQELAEAKGEEEAQYQAMKMRIKYMYENNDMSFLEGLFSSRSMSQFLNRITYVQRISEYDRNALDELVTIRETISQKETELADKQKELTQLQDTLTEKEAALYGQISTTESELASYQMQIALAREKADSAQNQAQQPIDPIAPERPQSQAPGTVQKDPIASVTADDVELLAALLECEAGTRNYEALLAVGSVVVNRMKDSAYPDTVYGVIYHPGQFPPATNGSVARVLANGVNDLCRTAAKDALAGKNNVGDCLSFRAASSGHDGIVIGGNVFF